MTLQTLYPALRYADAPAAIAWLERAFGFAPEHVHPGENGTIAHAQLRANRDVIMLGSPAYENGVLANASPKAFGGKSTLSLNLVVGDPDALFAKASAAGAEIVLAPYDTDYGSHSFAARDCEGYMWTFGTYAASSDGDISAGIRSRDTHRTIAWLRDACGFSERLVVPGDDGTVAHAELALGASVLMLGSLRGDEPDWHTPAELGAATGTIYAYCADPDASYVRARTAGAAIVRELEDMPYGSREFGIRAADGFVLTFGTYRP